MNQLQTDILSVIWAILSTEDFDRLYKEHAIRYGLLNYIAKYSLANDIYYATPKSLEHLVKNNFLKNGSLRRGIKCKKNGFTYEHPIPSNVIADTLIKGRRDHELVKDILAWSDKISILTTEEDQLITNAGLSKKMPNQWQFFSGDQYERYKISGVADGSQMIEVSVYGSLIR